MPEWSNFARFHFMTNKENIMSEDTKIAFVAGRASHGSGAHEHPGGCQFLADMINRHVEGVEAEVHLSWPTDRTAFDNISALAIYSDGGQGHPILPHLEQVSDLAKRGTGLVMMHYAIEVPKGDAGDHFVTWVGGYFETHYSVNPHWIAEFTDYPDHPIAHGLKPFEMDDEWYYHMRFSDDMKGVTPILSSIAPESTLTRPDGPHSGNPHVRSSVAKGEAQHLGWCIERPDGGRGVGFTGGHYHKNWGHEQMRKFMLNSILWAAKVDIPVEGIETPEPTAEELDTYI